MNRKNKTWRKEIKGRMPENTKKDTAEELQKIVAKSKGTQSVDSQNSNNKDQQNVENKTKTGSKKRRRRKRGNKLSQPMDTKNNSDTRSQLPKEYSYIQKVYTKNDKNEATVLNQFICLECYNVNLAEELKSRETKLYSDKDIPCSCCKKKTTQICVKDKELKKAQIEMTSDKTPEEARAYQIMTTRKKQNKSYQKEKRISNMQRRGNK